MDPKVLWRFPFSLAPIISRFLGDKLYASKSQMKNSNVWSSGGGFNKAEAQKEVARKTNVVKYICGSYLKAGFQISKSSRELKRKTQHGPLVETEKGPQSIRINERLF